jgi:hypothetical protein
MMPTGQNHLQLLPVKFSSHFVRAFVLLAALVLPLALITSAKAGVEDIRETGELVATVQVPAGFTTAEVQEGVMATLLGRNWGVKSKEDGRVIAYLKLRSNEAKVTLVYDTAKVDIFCVGWEIDKKTGVREKPEQPTRWLDKIQADLTKHFSRIAKHR